MLNKSVSHDNFVEVITETSRIVHFISKSNFSDFYSEFLFKFYPEIQMETNERSIAEKVRDLDSNTFFNEPSVSAEGYGSFIKPEKSGDTLFEMATHMKTEAEKVETIECISMYIESLKMFIKAQTHIKDDHKLLSARQRHISRFIDQIIVKTRKYDLKKTKSVLKWVLFNIKLQYIFGDVESVSKTKEFTAYQHILTELKNMKVLYESSAEEDYTIVELSKLEYEMTKRLKNADYK